MVFVIQFPIFKLSLSIVTNVSKDKVPATFLQDATDLLVTLFGKPRRFCMVYITPDEMISLGGSTEPTAHVRIGCVGCLGSEENQRHSAKVFDFFESRLGIKNDRMFVFFNELDLAYIGFKKTTMEELEKS